eukprot:362502-Hanusia_phi.AAC.1
MALPPVCKQRSSDFLLPRCCAKLQSAREMRQSAQMKRISKIYRILTRMSEVDCASTQDVAEV